MIKLMVRHLHHRAIAKVTFSSPEKIQQYAMMVNHREPTIEDIIGFMDGFSFIFESTSENVIHVFYCSYDCDNMVNKVSAYGPDGKVSFCAINYPGSWTDGTLTPHFLPYIKKRIGRYTICVHKGCPRMGLAFNIQYIGWNTKQAYSMMIAF